MEIDWRGLYFAASAGLNDTGDATPETMGLCLPLDTPGKNDAGKGNAWGAWLLAADEVGNGGENGSAG